MSYRTCNNCDFIINNQFYHEDECPSCRSTKMIDAVEDERDWDKLYKEQGDKLLRDIFDRDKQ